MTDPIRDRITLVYDTVVKITRGEGIYASHEDLERATGIKADECKEACEELWIQGQLERTGWPFQSPHFESRGFRHYVYRPLPTSSVPA